MSYKARMSTLRHFVRHYSRCPSVSDIVLVWNDGGCRGGLAGAQRGGLRPLGSHPHRRFWQPRPVEPFVLPAPPHPPPNPCIRLTTSARARL
jgi:hypothetical protein